MAMARRAAAAGALRTAPVAGHGQHLRPSKDFYCCCPVCCFLLVSEFGHLAPPLRAFLDASCGTHPFVQVGLRDVMRAALLLLAAFVDCFTSNFRH